MHSLQFRIVDEMCINTDFHLIYLQNFLETLDPFNGMDDSYIRDYLFTESSRLEPKGAKQPLKFVSNLFV